MICIYSKALFSSNNYFRMLTAAFRKFDFFVLFFMNFCILWCSKLHAASIIIISKASLLFLLKKIDNDALLLDAHWLFFVVCRLSFSFFFFECFIRRYFWQFRWPCLTISHFVFFICGQLSSCYHFFCGDFFVASNFIFFYL